MSVERLSEQVETKGEEGVDFEEKVDRTQGVRAMLQNESNLIHVSKSSLS